MFDWLKRKKKEDYIDYDVLLNYIEKAKLKGYSDEKIKQKFKESGYPNELISILFNIYEMKGGKMVKKKHKKEAEEEQEDEEETEEEPEEDEEEELEDDDEEAEPEEKPKKKVKPETKPEITKLTDEQIQTILTTHEQRLQANELRHQATESRLFRAGI